MTNDGTRAYFWDARNRLTGVYGIPSESSYDPAGRRILGFVGGTSTSFLYDGDNVVEEIQGGSPSATMMTGLGLDQRFSRTSGSSTSTYLTDNLGSTVALAGSSGTVQTSYAYDPYGVTTTSGAANTNTYQYTGRENDATGLYFLRARYYNPAWGRFISEDPIGLDGGPNLYAYVENNPLNWLDPWGLYHCVGGANCDITPPMQDAMSCFDQCTGHDTAVTSARRPPSPRHPNSSHSRGEACDVGRHANPDLDPDTARRCFNQCFPHGYGQEENNQGAGTHYHFQLYPVPGGHPGFSSGVQPYNP
jgi:RHS repeat-associated protein